MSEMILGGHVSASGGISQAIERAVKIGGNAVQYFSASPRVWKRMEPSETEIEKFKAEKEKHKLKASVIHAIYLLNLASENPELARKSREVIQFDLRVDALTQGNGVVVHLGSHLGRGFSVVKNQLVEQIQMVLAATPERSTFLIENSAGQNGKIASDLTEIRYLLDIVDSPRLGWCFDTCHGFAAGYSLMNGKPQPKPVDQADLFEEKKYKNIFEAIEALNLWEALKVIHLNDSRDPFDSGRDRHANIGDGEIGKEMLQSFLSHPRVRQLPLILEVPGMEGKTGPDAENVGRVKSLWR